MRGFRVDREHESAVNPLVWTFRLDRYDQDGNQLPSIPVVMRGSSFEGFIHEGDTVVLYDPWHEGTTVEATRVFNLTGRMEVKAIHRFDLFSKFLDSLFKSRSLFSLLLLGMLAIVLLITVAAICVIAITIIQFRIF